MYTITQIAYLENMTRQGVYHAIRQGRLKAKKIEGKWQINAGDLDEYKSSKYDRNLSTFNGEPLFNSKEISLKDAAILLGVNYQRMYYLIHSKSLKATRKGAAYVLSRDQIMELAMRTNTHQKIVDAI